MFGFPTSLNIVQQSFIQQCWLMLNLFAKSLNYCLGVNTKETHCCCAFHVFDFQVPLLFNGIFYIFKHLVFSQKNELINLTFIKAWNSKSIHLTLQCQYNLSLFFLTVLIYLDMHPNKKNNAQFWLSRKAISSNSSWCMRGSWGNSLISIEQVSWTIHKLKLFITS